MVQEVSHVEKFSLLSPFHSSIFSLVKKSCKNEHLRIDRAFFKKFFSGKNLTRLTTEDLLQVYPKVIEGGHEKLAEFIANRWLLKNMELYEFFEIRLKQINPQFDHIQEIPEKEAQELKNQASAAFGPVNCYIFCILNEVAFPKEIVEELRKEAVEGVTAHEKGI